MARRLALFDVLFALATVVMTKRAAGMDEVTEKLSSESEESDEANDGETGNSEIRKFGNSVNGGCR